MILRKYSDQLVEKPTNHHYENPFACECYIYRYIFAKSAQHSQRPQITQSHHTEKRARSGRIANIHFPQIRTKHAAMVPLFGLPARRRACSRHWKRWPLVDEVSRSKTDANNDYNGSAVFASTVHQMRPVSVGNTMCSSDSVSGFCAAAARPTTTAV